MALKNRFTWLNKTIVSLSTASFFSDFSHEFVTLLLPALLISIEGTKATPIYLGIISGISSFLLGIATFFFGWYSDHLIYKKKLLIFAYSLAGLSVALLAFAYDWRFVLCMASTAWFARGMISAPRNALISQSVPKTHIGRAFGFRQAFDTLGAIAAPLCIALISLQPHAYFLLTIIPGIIPPLVLFWGLKENQSGNTTRSSLPVFSQLPASFYVTLLICLLFHLANFNRTFLLLRSQEVISVHLVALLYVLRNIMQVISNYASGILSDKIGKAITLATFGFLTFSIASAGLMLANMQNITHVTILFILFGISAGTITTVEKALIADYLPEQVRGTGYGMFQALSSIGDLCANIIIGILWNQATATVAFGYSTILSLMSAFLLIFFIKK